MTDDLSEIFKIDDLTEIDVRTQRMQNLVLEDKNQEIIQAMSHSQRNAWKIDFVENKGEGQIVLLHG